MVSGTRALLEQYVIYVEREQGSGSKGDKQEEDEEDEEEEKEEEEGAE